MWDALMKDIRYALRWLGRSPAFTLAAVASLAIGIGFNTALFSVIDAVLFRPLPVAEPQRLVDIFTNASDGDRYATSSYPDFLDWKAGNAVFEDMIGYSPMLAAMNLPDRSRLVIGEVVTGNYFHMLGVGAAIGRALQPEDDSPGAPAVVMVSDRYWRRELGGDRSAIGQTIRLRGQTYAIVGVAPPEFTGMMPILAPELWMPMAHVEEVEPAGIQESVPSPTGTSRLDRRGQRWMFVKGRLREGATPEQAQANLSVLMRGLQAAYPQTNKARSVSVLPTSEVRIHPEAGPLMKRVAVGLLLAVGLVLLVACANVTSMLLARAAGRRREIGIRIALGAGRGRLVRQLLAESLVLSALGAVAGTVLAWWLTRAAATLELPIPVPISLDLRTDVRVLVFMAAASVLATLLAGLAPAIRTLRPNVIEALRDGAHTMEPSHRRWALRDALVAAQIAATVLLLVAAGLLLRGLWAAQRADVGFRTAGLALLSADLDMLRYEEDRSERFWADALERVRALPQVENAALAQRLPFSINFSYADIHIPGYQHADERPLSLQNTRASPDYFRTLGIPILQGRPFAYSDTADKPGVVVINETMAQRFWPGESALGKRIHLRGPEGPAFDVIGVAANHRLRTIGEVPQPYIHFAQTQRPSPYQVLVARTWGDATRVLAEIRRELLTLEPNIAFLDNQTMEAQVAATLLPIRMSAQVVVAVGAIAMMLAAVGLYGAIAYSVARRTREIGIRIALGASPSGATGLVMRQGLAVAVTGLGAGCLLAALAARALAGMLYGVHAADPAAWSLAVAVVMASSTVANLIPARRAARIAPASALREG
ncbi:MAG: ABC transporter permease [Acidobacteria bacterium]|nr:ABC transporter permease [Acidobacteriota bacterium]